MRYSENNPQNRINARKLKARLLPMVDAAVQKIASSRNFTDRGASAMSYFDLKLLDGVHVFQGEGGWIANLVFAGLPSGVPTTIGTPDGMALPTRDAAVDSALNCMAMVEYHKRVEVAAPTNDFETIEIDGLEIAVPLEYVFSVDSIDLDSKSRRTENERVALGKKLLDDICTYMTGAERGITVEDIENLDETHNKLFFALCARALKLGISRFESHGRLMPAQSTMRM